MTIKQEQTHAFVLGRRQDKSVSQAQKDYSNHSELRSFYTDKLKTYEKHLSEEERVVSKYKMQRIERKHLTLRIKIKRLQRKTICFSKIAPMHDLVIGLYINKYEFGKEI